MRCGVVPDIFSRPAGRPADALPPATESVALTRTEGGAALVLSLHRLADVLRSLGRHGEAFDLIAEADAVTADDP